jgi:hypothetical protein
MAVEDVESVEHHGAPLPRASCTEGSMNKEQYWVQYRWGAERGGCSAVMNDIAKQRKGYGGWMGEMGDGQWPTMVNFGPRQG